MKIADLIGSLWSTPLVTLCLKASPFGCTADVASAVVSAFSSGGGYAGSGVCKGLPCSGNGAKSRKELKSALCFIEPECGVHWEYLPEFEPWNHTTEKSIPISASERWYFFTENAFADRNLHGLRHGMALINWRVWTILKRWLPLFHDPVTRIGGFVISAFRNTLVIPSPPICRLL